MMTSTLTREAVLCVVWLSDFPGRQSSTPGFNPGLDVSETHGIQLFTVLWEEVCTGRNTLELKHCLLHQGKWGGG